MSSETAARPHKPVIYTSAVVFCGPGRTVLAARKRGTQRFMFPGGKPQPGENAQECALREVEEEIGIKLQPGEVELLGLWQTEAANEPGVDVHGTVYAVGEPLDKLPTPQAEIEELAWIDVSKQPPHNLSPLLRDRVIPALYLRGFFRGEGAGLTNLEVPPRIGCSAIDNNNAGHTRFKNNKISIEKETPLVNSDYTSPKSSNHKLCLNVKTIAADAESRDNIDTDNWILPSGFNPHKEPLTWNIDHLPKMEFGDDPTFVDTVVHLITTGEKTATASLDRFYDGTPPSRIGDLSVLRDSHQRIYGLCETSAIALTKMRDLSLDFIASEGKGCHHLDDWLEAHSQQWGPLDLDDKVWCEYFTFHPLPGRD